jgi:hypothetical protein
MLYVASPYTHAQPHVRRARAYCTTVLLGELMARLPHDWFFSPIVQGHAVAQHLPRGTQGLTPAAQHEFWMRQCRCALREAQRPGSEGLTADQRRRIDEAGHAVLRAYQRLVRAEYATGQAVIEHAGPIADSLVQSIATTMTRRYGRAVAGVAKANPSLLAGLRVRVGDDVYESSVSQQLAGLSV